MPTLQITDVSPRVQYTANASQTDYIVPFVFFVTTDLAVYVTPVSDQPDDFTQQLIINTDYTVTQNGNYTGTVTLNVASTAGDIVTIVRAMPDQRLNYYINGGAFTANAVNSDFESQVLMIQQNKMYDQEIAPHYNLSASPLPADVNGGQDEILPVLGPDQLWVKDATNNFIQAVDVQSIFPGVITWQVITVNTNMLVENGYFTSGAAQLTLALPATSVVGDTIRISSLNNFGFTVTQIANQYIQFGNQRTTVGSGGSLSVSTAGDTIELVCSANNVAWQVLDCMGNITFV